MRRVTVTIAAMGISAAVNVAAGTLEVTARSAVETALDRSSQVAATAAAARGARERVQAARGHRLPSVDLSETYNRTDSPAEAFALLLNQERFDAQEFFQSDPNDPDSLDTWITRVEVSQPVYTGGELSARIAQAERMAEAAELELRHARQRVIFDTLSAYADLAKAEERLSLMERLRATTEKHLERARILAEEGFIVSADVLRAEVHLAEMDEMVARAANGVQLAQAALAFEMGLEQSTELVLGPPPPEAAVEGELKQWLERAASHRRDLNAARRKVNASALEQRVERADFLPEVALVGRVDLYDDSPLGTHGTSSTVMAVARINLFRGGSDRAEVAAARHLTEARRAEVTRFGEGVRLQVRRAWHEVETATLRHRTAARSLDAAEETLRVREERFAQGLDRMIDLLDAETALRDAEVRELVARYDMILAAYGLHFAAGTSLGQHIELEEE